jgi:hypothetical protein
MYLLYLSTPPPPPKESDKQKPKIPDAEFLDEIQTKVKLTQPFTVSSVRYCTVYCIKEKGGKHDRKPHPLPYSLRNPYKNLKSGELSRLCPETSKKLYVHEFGFCTQ